MEDSERIDFTAKRSMGMDHKGGARKTILVDGVMRGVLSLSGGHAGVTFNGRWIWLQSQETDEASLRNILGAIARHMGLFD